MWKNKDQKKPNYGHFLCRVNIIVVGLQKNKIETYRRFEKSKHRGKALLCTKALSM